jgi:hypothetical protein
MDKMPKLKDLIPGKNVDKQEAIDMRSQMEKDAILKREICEAMNKFDEPISFTVHQRTGNWTMRNIAFWKALHDKDQDVIDYLTEIIGDKI